MTGDSNQGSKDMQPQKRFQSGGAVRPGVFYIERMADKELPEALLQGEFCYVLAPRQMGKSSLRVRTAERLSDQGVRCATVDLQKIGSGKDIKISDWYFSVLDEVNRGLNINCDLQAFWAKHGQQLEEGDTQGRSTLPHCWSAFLQYEVLAHTSVPIVIFIDEIDSVLSLPFSVDDFFAVIRSAHEARPERSEYNRLTFCLLGVAAPNDLIRDTTRTPFNIGRPVFLEDFSWPQTQSFISGISSAGSNPDKLLRTVFDWTDGQPYMTQKLCQEIAKGSAPVKQAEEETVRNLVDAIFLQRGRTGDSNLRYAEDRFDKIGSPSTKSQVLQLYRRLLNGQHVQLDAESPAQSELKLTGLAAERHNKSGLFLRQRNRIFATVFDKAWVREKEGERLFQEAITKWLEARQLGDIGKEYLLRGKALDEGLVWADTRADVTKEERDFLLASQEQASKDAVERTEARAAKRFRLLSAALAIATILALAAFAFAVKKAREAEASAEVAQQSNVILRQKTADLEAATGRLVDEQFLTKKAQKDAEDKAIQLKVSNEALEAQKVVAVRAKQQAEEKAIQLNESNAALRAQTLVAQQAKKDVEDRARELKESYDELELQKSLAEAAQEKAENIADALTKSNAELELQKSRAEAAQEKAEKSAAALKQTVQELEAQKSAAVKAKVEAVSNLKSLYLAYGKRELSLERPEPVRAAVYFAEICETVDPGHPDKKDLPIRLNLDWTSQFVDPLITLGERSNARLSPDGRRLLSADNDLKVQLWDAQTGKSIKELTENSILPPNPWSPDGKRLVAITSAWQVQLWDGEKGTYVNNLVGFTASTATAFYWSDDSRRLLTSEVNELKLWDAQTGSLVKELPTRLLLTQADVVWPPDGRRLVTVNKEGKAQLWDAETGAAVKDLPVELPSSYVKLLWAADGRRLVTVDKEGKVQVWDAETGLLINDLPVKLSLDPLGGQTSINLIGNRNRLLTSSEVGVKLWDVLTGTLVKDLPVVGTVDDIMWSRDGQRIMTLRGEKAQLWDGQSGSLVKDLPVTAKTVFGTGESRRLLTVSPEGKVQLWDAQTGAGVQDLPVLLHLDNNVDSISIGNGKRLLTGTAEEVKLWDSRTGSLVATLPLKSGDVDRVIWSEDGDWFVLEYSMKDSKEKEKLTQLWNAQTGEAVAFLPIKNRFNLQAELSWVGRRLLTRNYNDGSMHLWELKLKPSTTRELIEKVRQLAPFKLENEELVYKPGREPKKPEGQ